MSKSASKIGLKFYVLCGLSVAAAGGVYALMVIGDDAAEAVPSEPPGAEVSSPGNPPPWYYDQANDQHWDPAHNHWHSGPPPAAGQTPAPSPEVPAPPGVVNPSPWQYHAATDRHYDPGHQHWHGGPPPAAGQTPASIPEVPAPPGIVNPEPWQYDAATDRHYDPGHQHWHGGPPPGQPGGG